MISLINCRALKRGPSKGPKRQHKYIVFFTIFWRFTANTIDIKNIMFFGIFLMNFLLLQIVFTKYCKNWWKCCRKQWKYEKKNSGKKSITLAHSGGQNLIKMIFVFFQSLWVKSYYNMPEKLVQIDRVLEKILKMATMGRYLGKSSTDFFLIHVFWCLEGSQYTVGNRVVKTSSFCLIAFYSIVNTPTKKKPHRETPC